MRVYTRDTYASIRCNIKRWTASPDAADILHRHAERQAVRRGQDPAEWVEVADQIASTAGTPAAFGWIQRADSGTGADYIESARRLARLAVELEIPWDLF